MIAARSEYPKGGMWRRPWGYLEPLVKPLRGVQESRSLPAPSCVPFQFCDPSRRLLLFVLASGGSGVSPGGRWGAGSRAPVCFPPIPATFWPIPRLSLAGERICRLVGGADGDAELAEGRWRRSGKPQRATAALLVEARGRGEPTYFAHVCFSRCFGCPVSRK